MGERGAQVRAARLGPIRGTGAPHWLLPAAWWPRVDRCGPRPQPLLVQPVKPTTRQDTAGAKAARSPGLPSLGCRASSRGSPEARERRRWNPRRRGPTESPAAGGRAPSRGPCGARPPGRPAGCRTRRFPPSSGASPSLLAAGDAVTSNPRLAPAGPDPDLTLPTQRSWEEPPGSFLPELLASLLNAWAPVIWGANAPHRLFSPSPLPAPTAPARIHLPLHSNHPLKLSASLKSCPSTASLTHSPASC